MAEHQTQCEELQRPPQQEACCWRFEPVTVLGNQGVVVLTAKRFLFASQKISSNSSCSNGGEEKDGSGNKIFWEVSLQFPLVCWTSTERSKKAAKVLLLLLLLPFQLLWPTLLPTVFFCLCIVLL